MLTICTDNSIIDRLPMALCGIHFVKSQLTLSVCLKLNEVQ